MIPRCDSSSSQSSLPCKSLLALYFTQTRQVLYQTNPVIHSICLQHALLAREAQKSISAALLCSRRGGKLSSVFYQAVQFYSRQLMGSTTEEQQMQHSAHCY